MLYSAPAPPLLHSATCASGHLEGASIAAQLLHATDDALHLLRVRARVTEGHESPVRRDRMRSRDVDVTVANEWATFARATEPECL